MDKEFDLPVSFNNTELKVPARLLDYGYSYILELDIDGTKLLSQPDEERS